MNSIKNFLEKYSTAEVKLPDALASGEIIKVNINKEKRTVTFTVRFSEYIEIKEIRKCEKLLRDSKLELNSANI